MCQIMKEKDFIDVINDEMSCEITHHFVGLRLTMYSYKRDNNKEEKIIKGK